MKKDLTSARNYCESKGFHLVFIETSAEQDFIETALNNITDGRYHWIGVRNDSNAENAWMDGTTITYEKFSDNETSGGYCYRLAKWPATDEYEWADYPCDNELPYICEMNGMSNLDGFLFCQFKM